MEVRPLGLLVVGLDRFSRLRSLEWVNSLYRVLPWWLWGKDRSCTVITQEAPWKTKARQLGLLGVGL